MTKKNNTSEIGGAGFYAEKFFGKPLGDPALGLKSFSKFLFGIELEVNLPYERMKAWRDKGRGDDMPRKEVAGKVFETTKDFAIFTMDGSIPYGFEIKTAPCTYEYHLEAWKKFFDLVEKDPDLLERHGQGCGIHIHISKDGFRNKWHLGRMHYFVHRKGAGNRELMEKIAQRPYGYRGIKNPSDFEERHTHRTAMHIGVEHCPTAEVRIFKSTIVRNEFLKNLEFIHSVIRFTRPLCHDKHADLLTSERYQEYLGQHKQEYPNLWNFLNPDNLIDSVPVFGSEIKTEQKEDDSVFIS